MLTVWIEVDPSRQFPWCALASAIPRKRITTLCMSGARFAAGIAHRELMISTERPIGLECPGCAAILGETPSDDDLAIARETTADLRGPRALEVDALAEWGVDGGEG